MRKISIPLICTFAVALLAAGMATAFNGWLNEFNNIYATADTPLDRCALCHVSDSNYGFNPYGADVVRAPGATRADQIKAVENYDSDGDGFSNVDEIDLDTFPGDASSTPVTNSPPTARAAGPYSGTINEPAQFDGSGSSDSDGTIVAYDWDFGDGSTGTGPTPTHTYTVDDTYTVTLTVTDDAGDTGTDTTTATIGRGNQAPIADANNPYIGTVDEAVQFDGSGSADPDGAIVAYDWNFGDGNFGIGQQPTHIYTAAGTFNVTLTVTDDMGAKDSDTTTAAIGWGNQAPIADAGSPYSGTADEPVQFDGSGSSDPDGQIVAYSWDFGDGHTGTGPTPTHTYAVDGSFTVTLTVTDDAGETGTDTTTATIGPGNQAPIADANNPYNGTVDEPVQFDGSGSWDPDGTIVAYDWDFSDGDTGAGPKPTHTYTAAGTYRVTLTVTDDMGATDATTRTATIGLGNQAPIADAGSPYSGMASEAIQFDGSGSSDPDGDIVAYDWDFGDGSLGTGQNPTHAYTADGTYNVTLTVTDDMGAGDSITTSATIGQVTPPPGDDPVGDDDDEYDEYDDDELEEDDDKDDDHRGRRDKNHRRHPTRKHHRDDD